MYLKLYIFDFLGEKKLLYIIDVFCVLFFIIFYINELRTCLTKIFLDRSSSFLKILKLHALFLIPKINEKFLQYNIYERRTKPTSIFYFIFILKRWLNGYEIGVPFFFPFPYIYLYIICHYQCKWYCEFI